MRVAPIQLGLRGPAVEKYVREWTLGIEDISEFVTHQRQVVLSGKLEQLLTPKETIYTVPETSIANRLELDHGRPDGDIPRV